MKYFDVFAESGFHSAFLTTYAFGAQAFEDVPFSRLRGSGCRNIVILADRQMVNQSFAELGPPKFAGSSYHLVKADAPGAFHRLCCTNPVRDSSRESSVVAVLHEQTNTPDLQDQELARL